MMVIVRQQKEREAKKELCVEAESHGMSFVGVIEAKKFQQMFGG
jgi:hypothetical protein